jgi:DNA-binding transcriptional ArsR family regulator
MKRDKKDDIEMTFEDSFLNSRRAVEVLKILEESEEGNHATQMAREYKLDRSTVSRILKKLEARNMVKIAKRDQAKYFEPNYQGISRQAINLIEVRPRLPAGPEVFHEGIGIMADYYRQKFSSLEVEKERFPTLRDIMIVAPALELHEFVKGLVSSPNLTDDDLDILCEVLIIEFRNSLEIGVDDDALI